MGTVEVEADGLDEGLVECGVHGVGHEEAELRRSRRRSFVSIFPLVSPAGVQMYRGLPWGRRPGSRHGARLLRQLQWFSAPPTTYEGQGGSSGPDPGSEVPAASLNIGIARSPWCVREE